MEEEELYCWDFIDCPESVRSQCPVFRDKSHRCWEYEATQCRKIVGFSYDCETCRYYRSRAMKEAIETKKPSPKDSDIESRPGN